MFPTPGLFPAIYGQHTRVARNELSRISLQLSGEWLQAGPAKSAKGLGRVKTPTFNLRVEIPSRFRKFENQKCLRPPLREDDRENNSAHSWLVHVFTQPGSKPEKLNASKCFPLFTITDIAKILRMSALRQKRPLPLNLQTFHLGRSDCDVHGRPRACRLHPCERLASPCWISLRPDSLRKPP